ncbi:TRAP transporter small permease [Saccharospirillum mangrovi]|uniref:TRAP transporter small permease n=1 Tax=Saccharospirillum mangrovi TaxID=2161747 RepID=UPI000D3BA630|nr:TRAP transporter small permease [Saccharospirillum mangrovi]
MKSLVAQLSRGVDRLIGLSSVLGTLALVSVVVIVLVDVIGRNLLGHPLTGAQDLTQMGMVIIVFGGVALSDKLNAHISVDLLENSLPRWANRMLDALGWLLGAAFFIGIGVTILDSAAISRLLNLSTNILNLPKAWFQYAVAAFSFVTAASLLLRLVRNLIGMAPADSREETF